MPRLQTNMQLRTKISKYSLAKTRGFKTIKNLSKEQSYMINSALQQIEKETTS